MPKNDQFFYKGSTHTLLLLLLLSSPRAYIDWLSLFYVTPRGLLPQQQPKLHLTPPPPSWPLVNNSDSTNATHTHTINFSPFILLITKIMNKQKNNKMLKMQRRNYWGFFSSSSSSVYIVTFIPPLYICAARYNNNNVHNFLYGLARWHWSRSLYIFASTHLHFFFFVDILVFFFI